MVAAVAPMAAFTLPAQISRAAHRALATFIGLLVAVGLLRLDLAPTVTLLVVAALQGTAELLVARNYAAALVFVTPLALLLGQLADPQPVAELVTDRFVETLIGVGVGVGVGVLVVLLTRPRARAAHPVPHA